MWGTVGIWLGNGRLFIHPWWGFIPRDTIYSHKFAASLMMCCEWHEKGRSNINKAERMLKMSVRQLSASSYSCFMLPGPDSHLQIGTLFFLGPLVPLSIQSTLDAEEGFPSAGGSFLLSQVSVQTPPRNMWSRACGSCHNLYLLVGNLIWFIELLHHAVTAKHLNAHQIHTHE